jgi:hypothetical protein
MCTCHPCCNAATLRIEINTVDVHLYASMAVHLVHEPTWAMFTFSCGSVKLLVDTEYLPCKDNKDRSERKLMR